jgi:hypothetical protein
MRAEFPLKVLFFIVSGELAVLIAPPAEPEPVPVLPLNVQFMIDRVEYDVATPPPFPETELVLSTLLLMLTMLEFLA